MLFEGVVWRQLVQNVFYQKHLENKQNSFNHKYLLYDIIQLWSPEDSIVVLKDQVLQDQIRSFLSYPRKKMSKMNHLNHYPDLLLKWSPSF